MMVMAPMIIIEMEPAIMAFNLYEVITKVYFCGRMQSLDQCQFNSILLFISGEGLFMFTGRNCFAPGQLVVVGYSGRDGPRSSEKVCFFEFLCGNLLRCSEFDELGISPDFSVVFIFY